MGYATNISIALVLLLSIVQFSQQYGQDLHIDPYELGLIVEESTMTTTTPRMYTKETFNYSKSTMKNEKCMRTKLSYDVFPFYYTWPIENLLDYLNYCRKFEKALMLSSPEFAYEASSLHGTWKFSLSFFPRGDERLQLAAEFASSGKKYPELEILCKVVIDEKEISLPDVRSTGTYFKWHNISNIFENVTFVNNETVEFQFTVNYYQSIELSTASNDFQNCAHENFVRHRGPIQSFPPFTKDLKDLMEDEKYIDVVIKTKNSSYGIHAHRVILAKSSPVLAALVYNSTYEKNESIIDMEDVEHGVAKKLVLYLYTGQTDHIEIMADQLIILAHRYQLADLKSVCETILIRNVKLDNALKMYSLGNEIFSSKLTKRAFAVMKENKTKLATRSEEFKILSSQYPNLMFELFVS